MKWATYRSGDGDTDRVGLVVEDSVRGLEPGTRLVDLLGDDGSRLADAGARAERSPAEVVALADARLRPPIPNPPAIRDFSAFEEHMRIGLNAIGQEMGKDWYEIPVFYFSNPNSLKGSGDVVRVPGHTQKMDFELEFCAIVGQGGIDLDPADADRHIAGFCIYNDWSARDIQTRETATCPIGPAKGKDFANSLGPWMVTPDELEPFRSKQAYDLTMTATINGREYSRGNLHDIYWNFGQMAAYASRDAELFPGDVLGTGTVPTGCALERSITHPGEYPWLAEGDEVVLEVEHIGTLANTVTFGPQPKPLK